MLRRQRLSKLTGLSLALLATSVLSASTLAADGTPDPAINKIIDAEVHDFGNVYSVTAPSKSLANRAAITFHGNLLSSDSDKHQHTMSLTADEREALLDFGFKVSPDTTWLTKYRQKREQQLQFAPSGKIETQSIPGYSCYPTVEETFTSADGLAASNPTLASTVDIGDSWEKSAGLGGYDLKVLKITNSAITGDKPKMFIHSAMHAREYTTAALTLEFATQLLDNYGTDADATWIVDHHEIHFLFHMNPDGRKKAETGLYWRKNTNQNYCSATSNSRGADLNRNFTHSWNSTGGVGSSGNSCSSTYRGPSAASEPETQAVEAYVRSLFPDNRGPLDTDAAPDDTMGLHLDVHSYSELVLWPWGNTSTPSPNGTALQTLGRKLAFWNGYEPIQSIGLYPTDGTSDSISYGELGVPNFTYELGTAFFQDCATFENTIKPDNLPSLEYAAKILRAPYLMPSGPEVHTVKIDGLDNGYAIPGDQISLTAIADDTRYENQNGTEPSQKIIEAEYYVNVMPWESGAVAYPMTAADGSFSAKIEDLSATIDSTDLLPGRNLVYVRAKDNNGQWGAGSAGFLILPIAPNVAPTARWWYRCEDLSCEFVANKSSDSDGDIVSYYWKLEAGVAGTFGNPKTYTYTDYGIHRPFLTVKDNDGAKDKKRRRLVLSPPGSANNPTGVIEGFIE